MMATEDSVVSRTSDSVSLNLMMALELEEEAANRLALRIKKRVHLHDLMRETSFSKDEIRMMYRGFKQECPAGIVREETFKAIYAKFFPHGNSGPYAHHVFKAFDANRAGAISFKDMLVSLSTLLRGTTYERLRWTFGLYDLNDDGFITRQEVLNVMLAVHDMMGAHATPPVHRDDLECRLDEVFRRLDLNADGVVTLDEFIEACQHDPTIARSLENLDARL